MCIYKSETTETLMKIAGKFLSCIAETKQPLKDLASQTVRKVIIPWKGILRWKRN
jgi:hypothetical protein